MPPRNKNHRPEIETVKSLLILQDNWKGYSVVVVDEDLRGWIKDEARARGESPTDTLRTIANEAIRARMAEGE